MNRNIFIFALSLGLAAGTALAEETDLAPSMDWGAFQGLAKKNIFDPNRAGPASYASKPRPKVIRTFTFHGTIDTDAALFTGEGVVDGKGYFRRGETLNGFKVMKIPLNYTDPTVILTDPSGEIVVLKQGESMRREDEGPWSKTDQIQPSMADTAAPSPSAATTPFPQVGPKTFDASGTELHGAAREQEILKQLRLKREQEDK